MGLAKVIFSFVMVGIMLYLTISAFQRMQVAQEEVEIAQKQVDIATAEYEQAQKEVDNIIKYGCENPTVTPGLVQCP